MFIQIVTIFIATIFLTVAQVLDEYVTVVKNDRTRAVFWGFFSWILAGIIIVNISGTPAVKILSVLSAGLGAACGNLFGIKIIQIIKKQKRTNKSFISLLWADIKRSYFQRVKHTNIYKFSKRILRKTNPRKQLSQTTQPTFLSFFRQ